LWSSPSLSGFVVLTSIIANSFPLLPLLWQKLSTVVMYDTDLHLLLMKSRQVILANHYHLSLLWKVSECGYNCCCFSIHSVFLFISYVLLFVCFVLLFFRIGFPFFYFICSVICLVSLLCSLGFSFLCFYFHMSCCWCILCFLFFRGLFHVFSSFLVMCQIWKKLGTLAMHNLII
jgi:hypothetical protein